MSKAMRMITAILLVASCSVLTAHHSAAMFDDSKCVNIEGTVQKVNMNYPHVWIWIVTKDAKGADVEWSIESTDPASLRIQGWAPGSVKKGDKLAMVINPVRDGRKIASVKATRMPNGKVVTGGGPVKCPLPWKTESK
jgi:hypothetical protein